jgi:hypothetical protein
VVIGDSKGDAVSVGAELRENVDDVLFTNCDVIHNKGREWTLRVFHCDSARVSNVRFSDLRIEDSRRLISVVDQSGRLDKGYQARSHRRCDLRQDYRDGQPVEDRTSRLRRHPFGGKKRGFLSCGAQWPPPDSRRREVQRLFA